MYCWCDFGILGIETIFPVAGRADVRIDQMEEDHETLWLAEQLAAAVTVPAVCFPRAALPVPSLFRGKEFILFGGENTRERKEFCFIILYFLGM